MAMDERANSQDGQASIFSSIVNVTNTTVGAGLLVQPYGFSYMGWALGLILITFVYITSIVTNLMIADAVGMVTNPRITYQIMADQALPHFSYLVDAAAVIVAFGIGCSYTIVAIDNMSMITGTNRWIWAVVYTLCTAPVCFLRNIDALHYTSTASNGCLLFVSSIVVAYASSADKVGTGDVLDPCAGIESVKSCKGSISIGTNSFFRAMGGLVFFLQGMVCQFTSPYIIREMRQPTRLRVAMVYAGGSGLAYILYSVVGVAGYLTYGDNVKGNILLNYPNNALNTTSRILITLVVLCGYPMSCYSARESIQAFVAKLKCLKCCNKIQERSEESRLQPDNDGDLNWKWHLSRDTLLLDPINGAITCAWLLLTMLVGLFVMDIAITLGIAGATGTPFLFFIAPGVMHLRLFHNSPCDLLWIVNWMSIVFGLLVLIFGILFLVNPTLMHA